MLIDFFSGRAVELNAQLFIVSGWSFFMNIPVSLMVNYIIQNRLPLSWRFIVSSLFSEVLAVYYALSGVLFSGMGG